MPTSSLCCCRCHHDARDLIGVPTCRLPGKGVVSDDIVVWRAILVFKKVAPEVGLEPTTLRLTGWAASRPLRSARSA